MESKQKLKDVLILTFFYSIIVFGAIVVPKRLAWIEQQKKTDLQVLEDVKISPSIDFYK